MARCYPPVLSSIGSAVFLGFALLELGDIEQSEQVTCSVVRICVALVLTLDGIGILESR